MTRVLLIAVMLVGAGCRTRLPRQLPVDPELALACVRFVSCHPPRYWYASDSIGLCIFHNESQMRAASWIHTLIDVPIGSRWFNYEPWGEVSLSCVNAATDCAGVQSCIAGDDPDACGPPPSPATAECRDEAYLSCSAIGPTLLDCTLTSGYKCLLGDDGKPRCAAGPCPPGRAGAWCEGADSHQCVWGLELVSPCGSGAVCSEGKCRGDGAPCDKPRCEGRQWVACAATREALPFDCEAQPIPGICDPWVNQHKTHWWCKPTDVGGCAVSTYLDHCEGTRLVYCDGEEQEIDCSAIGFTTCSDETGRATCR